MQTPLGQPQSGPWHTGAGSYHLQQRIIHLMKISLWHATGPCNRTFDQDTSDHVSTTSHHELGPDGRTKSESVAIYHMMGMVYQQLAMSKLPDEVLILHVTCHSCASTFPTQITHMATCWVESTYDKLEEEEKA